MKTTPVRIVIPDAGPLITLAKINALDALLVFNDSVRIVITDYVEFEVTRNRHVFPDAAVIANFIAQHAGRIEIESTNLGQLYKSAVQIRERFESNPELAKQMGIAIPPEPENPGEMTIVQYVKGLVEQPPGTPVLIIAEDDYFLRDPATAPGNAHIVSTRSFLAQIENLAKLPKNKSLWKVVQQFRSGAQKAKLVDRPARKINTDWLSALSKNKLEELPSRIKSVRPGKK